MLYNTYISPDRLLNTLERALMQSMQLSATGLLLILISGSLKAAMEPFPPICGSSELLTATTIC